MDFISFPLKTVLPKTYGPVHKSVGIMGRGGERGVVHDKTMSGTPVVEQFKICAILRRFLFLVNRKAVSFYVSEHK